MQIIVTCRTSDNNPKFRPEVNNSHALWFGVPNQVTIGSAGSQLSFPPASRK